jgi:hypothetical protein
MQEFFKVKFMISVFGWPGPNMRELSKSAQNHLPPASVLCAFATFLHVWISPSKHGNHKVIVYCGNIYTTVLSPQTLPCLGNIIKLHVIE